MIIDLSNILKEYKRLKKKFSKLSKEQLIQKHVELFQFCNKKHEENRFLKQIIKNKLLVDNQIKEQKFIKYFSSNSRNKDACFKIFKKEKLLGKGGYGQTYLASKGNFKYAVKVQEITNIEISDLKKEIKLTKKMGKLGVGPKLYDYYICKEDNKNKLFMVMEYMSGGDLYNWLGDGNKLTAKLKKDARKKLKIMHDNGIIHNDLHEGNIFIQNKNNKPELFIGDFGISETKESLIRQNFIASPLEMTIEDWKNGYLINPGNNSKESLLFDFIVNKLIFDEILIIDFPKIYQIYQKIKNKYKKYSKSKIKDLGNKLKDNKNEANENNFDKMILDDLIFYSHKYKEISKFKKTFKNLTEYIPNSIEKNHKIYNCLTKYKIEKHLGYFDSDDFSLVNSFYNMIVSENKKLYNLHIIDPDIDRKHNEKNRYIKIKNKIKIAKKMGELGIGPKLLKTYYCKNNNNGYKIYLLFEYISDITLKDWINGNKKYTKKMYKQINDKIKKIKSNKIIIQNIKSNMILVNPSTKELFINNFYSAITFDNFYKNKVISDNNMATWMKNNDYETEDLIEYLILDEIHQKNLIKLKI